MSTRENVLFASAAAVRLSLAATFPGLPDLLSGRVEISTPVTSFKRLQEGLFLYNHGLSPYDGGVFHQAPLLLPLFSLLPDPRLYPLVTVLLYTLVDLASAYALMQIYISGQSYASRFFSSPRASQKWSPAAVAASYLFNPFVIVTCLGRSTNVFGNLFVLLSIQKATSGLFFSSAFALSLASYISLHPLLLLPPIALLCHDANATKSKNTSPQTPYLVRYAAVLGLNIAFLFGLSYTLTNDWSFLQSVYLTRLLLPDLTPNVGLWWYFFIEIFDSFRNFFLGVFWLHAASYSPAITLRLRNQPLAAVVLLCGIFSIFQPYANVGDAGLFLSMLAMYGHLFELTRYTFPSLSALLYTTLLGPAFHHLWLYAGSGNANFFYAITLVWSLALSVILADVLYAVLRDEWEKDRPDMKGKDTRQI